MGIKDWLESDEEASGGLAVVGLRIPYRVVRRDGESRMIGDLIEMLAGRGEEDDLVSLIEIQIYKTICIDLGRDPYISGGKWRFEAVCIADENDVRKAAQDVYDLLHGRGVIGES